MNDSADVYIAFPPGLGNRNVFRPHLGVAYLQAALREKGIDVRQYTPTYTPNMEQVVEDMIAVNPKVVGLTAYDSNIGSCLNIAERVKAQRPDIWVVFGGPAATFSHKFLLSQHRSIDLCIRGETEETGGLLFTYLLDVTPGDVSRISEVRGVAYRDGDRVRTTGLSPLVGQGPTAQNRLDTVPSPYLEGILTDGRAGILTGRGCIQNCVYCCFAALARKKLRLHSLERVVAELEVISARTRDRNRKHRVTVFDDAFTLVPKRAMAICEALSKKNLGLPLACITRADTVDRELIVAMKKAGFMAVAFGLESAVPSVLRAIGKVRPPDCKDPDLTPEREFLEQVRLAVGWAHELGLTVGVSIMLGLPKETPEDAAATMTFVKELPVAYYMHNTLSVFPGTPLWKTQNEYGIESTMNVHGLPSTTRLPYDVNTVCAAPLSNRANEAALVRQLAVDGLYACEAPQANDGVLSMVVIRDSRISERISRWLAGVLCFGGIVIQVCSDERALIDRRDLMADREMLASYRVPFRFHIQLVPAGQQNGQCTWRVLSEVSNVFETHQPEAVSLREDRREQTLQTWLAIGSESNDVCSLLRGYSESTSHNDVSTCSNDQDVPAWRRPIPPILAYSGRMTEFEASCQRLSRIEIDDNDAVRVCRHGEKIGEIGEPLEVLRMRLIKFVRRALSRRATRNWRMSAPSCPFPGMQEQVYCELFDKENLTFREATVQSRLRGILTYARDEYE